MIDPYVYEDTGTLKNKLGIKDYDELRQAEADLSFVKLLTVDRDVDCKKFDLEYVKNIHKYVLNEIYDWAGEFRTIPMEKPEKVLDGMSVEYEYPTNIEKNAKEILDELNRINWSVKELDDKVETFSNLIAKLWKIHPFRDGNTRTVVVYAFRFAEEHGFPMDRSLLINNFSYVRDSLVMASLGEYSEPEYLNKIVKNSLENEMHKEGNIEKEDNLER